MLPALRFALLCHWTGTAQQIRSDKRTNLPYSTRSTVLLLSTTPQREITIQRGSALVSSLVGTPSRFYSTVLRISSIQTHDSKGRIPIVLQLCESTFKLRFPRVWRSFAQSQECREGGSAANQKAVESECWLEEDLLNHGKGKETSNQREYHSNSNGTILVQYPRHKTCGVHSPTGDSVRLIKLQLWHTK